MTERKTIKTEYSKLNECLEKLGIEENITSPTFNIVKEYYSGEMPLFHMDVYRLDGKVDGVGIEDYYTWNFACDLKNYTKTIEEFIKYIAKEICEKYIAVVWGEDADFPLIYQKEIEVEEDE